MKIKDAAVAAEELDDALTYYRDVHPDFAEALFHEVSRAKKLIVQFPYAWKNYGGGLYGFVVRRYPYTIVYRVSDDAMWVLAYAHHKRRRGYWRGRLPQRTSS
ncbi:MAG: type II toxin-antitoxin system RelE/ParE family toxin [Sterolibacterium sp.]